MPKTIAITPSWYWPAGISRVVGVPPYSIYDLCVVRNERHIPQAPAIIDAQGTLTFEGLRAEVDRRAKALALAAGEARIAVLPGALSRDNVLELLAGLASGVKLHITSGDPATVATGLGAPVVAGQQPPGETSAVPDVSLLDPSRPAVVIEGGDGPVSHSNRSLLAMAISMATFVDAGRDSPWFSTLPLSTWQGLMAVLLPLHLGAPLVIPPANADPDTLLGLIPRHQVKYAIAGIEGFAHACREAKRAAKDSRKMLAAALLSVDGPFDPDQRRRVGKALECPALTFWGMPETGPVFAAHQSWYIDESVGLPMTNAHVVPSDPRSGQPIQALWELVEMAEVTVFSPSLMADREAAVSSGRFAGNRFRTGMMASSDANGMVYLLGR
ncbi:MAG: AMP-binding protein [Dehalococcoidia bacterium]|nr:AMP-binding protein [Dehalococcoidia bacterium]